LKVEDFDYLHTSIYIDEVRASLLVHGLSWHLLIFPAGTLRLRRTNRSHHCRSGLRSPTDSQVRQPATQGPFRRANPQGKKAYLYCHYRARCRIRRRQHRDYRCQDRRWEALHRQWDQEMVREHESLASIPS
jgi:hypothetical protein